ncbi:MAG TPA: VOC family protein [Bacteroidota bacterium]|nr:VOC family protein [Bacteroidota bacterium]
MHTMNNALNWFEIPASDIKRAKAFYEAIFNVKFGEMVLANNLKMALFPTETGTVGGALCEHPDFYRPGYQGPLVYLNGNPDLQTVLDRIPKFGGKVLVPKTQISDQYGYMAVFEDCEGNRLALHSNA